MMMMMIENDDGDWWWCSDIGAHTPKNQCWVFSGKHTPAMHPGNPIFVSCSTDLLRLSFRYHIFL